MGDHVSPQKVGRRQDVVVHEEHDLTTSSAEAGIASTCRPRVCLPEQPQGRSLGCGQTPEGFTGRRRGSIVDNDDIDSLKAIEIVAKHT
jgi:hypothetical protein